MVSLTVRCEITFQLKRRPEDLRLLPYVTDISLKMGAFCFAACLRVGYFYNLSLRKD